METSDERIAFQGYCRARGHRALEGVRKGRRHDCERRWPFPAQGRAAGFESAPNDGVAARGTLVCDGRWRSRSAALEERAHDVRSQKGQSNERSEVALAHSETFGHCLERFTVFLKS